MNQVNSVMIYRKGISGKLPEFAVKKYGSHRRVPDSVYNKLKFEFYVSSCSLNFFFAFLIAFVKRINEPYKFMKSLN